jgi:hypothetical protein
MKSFFALTLLFVFALLSHGNAIVPPKFCIAKYECPYEIHTLINTHRYLFPNSTIDRSCWNYHVKERLIDLGRMNVSNYNQCHRNFHKNMCMMVEEQILSPADDICLVQYFTHIYKASQCRYGYKNVLKLRPLFIKRMIPIKISMSPWHLGHYIVIILFLWCVFK